MLIDLLVKGFAENGAILEVIGCGPQARDSAVLANSKNLLEAVFRNIDLGQVSRTARNRSCKIGRARNVKQFRDGTWERASIRRLGWLRYCNVT